MGNPLRGWDRLRWAFSPCPNDTFIFSPLVLGSLPGLPAIGSVTLLDIKQLNDSAEHGEYDVVKISAAHYSRVSAEYEYLNAGGALGFGVGPLLVARPGFRFDETSSYRVAIPGHHTTAASLLSILYPKRHELREYLFSDIMNVVLRGDCDMGLLIHESRFTYADRGLQMVLDLGEEWENRYGLPLPLGVIAVRRSLPSDLREGVSAAMLSSVEYAMARPEESLEYVGRYATELDAAVQQAHISLYVNTYTVDMGVEGRAAMDLLVHLQGLNC